MDKEEYIELMEKFITHTKEYCPETFEWVMENMEKNSMFYVNGENHKEQFGEMI